MAEKERALKERVLEEELPSLTPINFFQLCCDCKYIAGGEAFPLITKKNYKKYLLPSTAELCSERAFAQLALGWNEEGMHAFVQVDHPFSKVAYPEVDKGDSVQLCFDTRDVKSATFNTRFCHHFFFLPEAFEGKFAGEITRFRTEDAHPLCDASDLKLQPEVGSYNWCLHIFIPTRALVGFEPAQFNRIGFTYKINRAKGEPQHFSVVTSDYNIDQQPSLWASLKLVS